MKKYIFKKDNFTILRKAISPELSEFIYNYFLLKKQVYYTMNQYNYLNPFDKDWGYHGDGQVANAFGHYSDIAMETLLLKCQDIMEKTTGLKLFPTYSYARAYTKGCELVRHKDRLACEISTTMNLGGDEWPIFIEPNLKKGNHDPNGYIPSDCVQVFLHYVNKKNKDALRQIFDTRKHVGLPSWFKGNIK